jgi:hypothetical protein
MLMMCLGVQLCAFSAISLRETKIGEEIGQKSPVLVIFERESRFMPRLAWTVILLFVLPDIAGITATCH